MKNLGKVETAIVEARIGKKTFFELSETEFRYATDQIIFRTAAIMGSGLPHTEYFATVLHDQIVNFFLNYGFEYLTAEEVYLALELNVNTQLKMPSGITLNEIPFEGECVNVSFLSKILRNYMVLRNYIDRTIQNALNGYN